jgi:hypothetical protein
MIKQNRYNHQSRGTATTAVSRRHDDSADYLLAEVGTGSVSAVYTRLVTTVGGQLFAQYRQLVQE